MLTSLPAPFLDHVPHSCFSNTINNVGNKACCGDRRVRQNCLSDVIEINFQTTSYFGEILLFGDGGQDVRCPVDSGV